MPADLLRIDALHFAHPGAPDAVFRGLSASLPAGLVLVCGDESTGKSTLLRLLAGALRPDGGQLLWQGAPLASQEVAWFDPLDTTTHERIVSDWLAEQVPAHGALAPLLAGLSLEAHLHKPLYQLSTGSRRKVFMAAALARQAPLTLLDQPFMALDRPSIDFLCAELQARASERSRLLMLADYQAPEGLVPSATLDLDTWR